MALVAAPVAPLAAEAQTIACILADAGGATVPLSFAIDPAQFAPPQDINDPPRRKVTTVQMGQMRFTAEPFMIADTLGFSSEALGGHSAVFVMQPDGTGTYAVARTGERLTGQCEVVT